MINTLRFIKGNELFSIEQILLEIIYHRTSTNKSLKSWAERSA